VSEASISIYKVFIPKNFADEEERRIFAPANTISLLLKFKHFKNGNKN